MLARPRRPSIPSLSKSIISGDRPAVAWLDAGSSPTSPLERNPLSPRGWKNRDSDGVGLGIVARAAGESPPPPPAKRIIGSSNLNVSAPIPINSARSSCSSMSMDFEEFSMEEEVIFPALDFLSSCYLCRKRLDGKDIYMYRGEKAFCSQECRLQQIVSDECLEKCGSEIRRPEGISSMSHSGGTGGGGGRLFFTGGIVTA